MKKWIAAVVAVLLLVLATVPAFAASNSITCYGEDLSASQYEKVMDLLGADLQNDTLVSVTIDDEKKLLSGLVEESLMGSRSLSSARITLENSGHGISVVTHNVDYVTSSMYANALSTAGIENASVVVAAPTTVSGTAALAGIFKAYEAGTNQTLNELAKAVAGEELVTMAQLAETIGPEEAAELIAMLKQFIAENDLTDPAKAKTAVDDACKQLGITLTDAQKQQVIDLLVRFNELNLDPEKIAEQLNSLGKSIQVAQNATSAVANFFEGVKNTFTGILDWFKGLFS